MSAKVDAFEPHYMRIGILTAALQELTPRQIRDADPDRAIEDWLAFARELGADNIQLSAALHPSEADVPEEAIAYTPGTWIALHRICERSGVGDQFRIHHDPSHAILMGQDTRSIFQYLKDTGYNFLIGGFHVKGQVIKAQGVSAWGYGGQTIGRGDWVDGKPSQNPAEQAKAWRKQTVLCEHELPGTAKHDPLAYLQNRTVDWLDHQLAARELLELDVPNTQLIVEHEYPPARIQDAIRLKPILQGSIAFTRKIDEAAACMFALQHGVLAAQKIPIQGG